MELTSLESYSITVQPVTIFEGATLMGERTDAVVVRINTLAPDVTSPDGTVDRNSDNLVVDLPPYTDFGNNVV